MVVPNGAVAKGQETDRIPTAAALALLAAAVWLRVAFLGERQLFRDEGASWLLARFPISDLVKHAQAEPYPPLYPLTLKAWTLLSGDSEAALRALSVLFGMIMVVAGWRWAIEALGRHAGLVALALLSFSPLALANAKDVRMYAMESAWTTLSWWLLWRVASGRSRGRRRQVETLALALTVAAELWTFTLGLGVAALQLGVACLLWLRWRRAEDLRTGGAIALAGVTFLPWLPSVLAHAGRPFWTPIPGIESLRETFMTMAVGSRSTPWMLSEPLVLVLVVVGVVVLAWRGPTVARSDGGDRRVPVLGATVIAGLAFVPLVWIYSQVHSVYDARYFGPSIAPLALAAAAGWGWLSRRAPKVARIPATGVFAVLLFGGALTWLGGWRSTSGPAPAREALGFLDQRMRPGDIVLVEDARSYFSLAYLLGRDGARVRLPGPLYVWQSATEPFFDGQSLLDPRTLAQAERIARIGWSDGFSGLAAGGRIWLVSLATEPAGRRTVLPLDAGDLQEIGRVFVTSAGATGEIRELVIVPRSLN